jgi:hypothetical protein
MPTTTTTAPPRAKINAEQFGARLEAAGWDVKIKSEDWSALRPAQVLWGVSARKGVDLITFSWSTVTGQGVPRTTRYRGGKLRRPLAPARKDQEVTLRTSASLNDLINSLSR